MKPKLLSAVLTCVCLGAISAAASPFSASVGYGIAKVEGGEVNAPYLAPYTLSDDTTYLRFAVSCDVSHTFALEASYYLFQNIDAEMSWGGGPPPFPSYSPSTLLAWEIRTLALGPTFTWTPSDKIYLRAGVACTLTTSDTSLYAGRYGSFHEESDNVAGFEGHLTFDYAFTDRFALGANLATIAFGTEMATTSKVTALTGDIRLLYRF
jgi:hypothetical protein